MTSDNRLVKDRDENHRSTARAHSKRSELNLGLHPGNAAGGYLPVEPSVPERGHSSRRRSEPFSICRRALRDLPRSNCLNEDQPCEYRQVSWSGSAPVLVVHRLCVAPLCQGQGVGRYLMDFAEDQAVRREYSSIRPDAYSGNLGAVRLYKWREYINVGEVYFPRRDLPFYCFEKVIT